MWHSFIDEVKSPHHDNVPDPPAEARPQQDPHGLLDMRALAPQLLAVTCLCKVCAQTQSAEASSRVASCRVTRAVARHFRVK